jgi:hypothetical protein
MRHARANVALNEAGRGVRDGYGCAAKLGPEEARAYAGSLLDQRDQPADLKQVTRTGAEKFAAAGLDLPAEPEAVDQIEAWLIAARRRRF